MLCEYPDIIHVARTPCTEELRARSYGSKRGVMRTTQSYTAASRRSALIWLLIIAQVMAETPGLRYRPACLTMVRGCKRISYQYPVHKQCNVHVVGACDGWRMRLGRVQGADTTENAAGLVACGSDTPMVFVR